MTEHEVPNTQAQGSSPNYQAHPMLDPEFFEKDTLPARFLIQSYQEMSVGETAYAHGLNRLLNPIDRPRPFAENLEFARRYLVDVNAYIREVVGLLAPRMRKGLAMDPEVAALNDTLELLGMAMDGDSERMRFEAQRKLYLAKLLFDVDHDPGVQMGPVHREYFENLLDRQLWSGASRTKPVDIYYDIAADGIGIEVGTKQSAATPEVWRFRVTPIRRPGSRTIHVYHYACRFKREVAAFTYRSGADSYEVRERPIWETLHERRSGSILSKMIRKGEVHPRKIQDILGAMFIVNDIDHVYRLQETLYRIFGGPLRWKDRVNTIVDPSQSKHLNAQSGRGYEVMKSDVDVLYAPPDPSQKPYIFAVEVQLYTVEGFLRTVHSRHYASHQRLKLRQFLEGLLPVLFPTVVYGESLIRECLESVEVAQPEVAGRAG